LGRFVPQIISPIHCGTHPRRPAANERLRRVRRIVCTGDPRRNHTSFSRSSNDEKTRSLPIKAAQSSPPIIFSKEAAQNRPPPFRASNQESPRRRDTSVSTTV